MSRLARRVAVRVVASAGVGVVLTAAWPALQVAPAAAATPSHGATGLHTQMLPTGSPDRGASAGPVLMSAMTSTTATTTLAGPDVASYQHPNGATIDWAQVAGSGQAFAIIKATELYTSNGQPTLYTNPYLSSDLQGAETAGIVVGAYAFGHPENSPVAQADDFAAAVGALPPGSLPPVLDLEVDGGLSPAALVAWTQAFLDRLEADTGVVPMIYTGPYFWAHSMGGSTAFTRYPLWEAHYTTASAPDPVGGWSGYTLWQYTDSATIPGISTKVDQSRFNGNRSSLTAVAQPSAPATLASSGVLTGGQVLRSPNGQYELAMQGDGNVVVYGNGRALWSTATWGHPGAYLAMQSDANLVVYDSGGRALWSSKTSGKGTGAYLAIQNDGNLVIYAAGRALWNTHAPGSNMLTVYGQLRPGQYLHMQTPYRRATLMMRYDGALVLYVNGVARWSSGTKGRNGAHAVLQRDGNFVVYDTYGVARWSSRTFGTGHTNRLVLLSTGNLAVYNAYRLVWSTHI